MLPKLLHASTISAMITGTVAFQAPTTTTGPTLYNDNIQTPRLLATTRVPFAGYAQKVTNLLYIYIYATKSLRPMTQVPRRNASATPFAKMRVNICAIAVYIGWRINYTNTFPTFEDISKKPASYRSPKTSHLIQLSTKSETRYTATTQHNNLEYSEKASRSTSAKCKTSVGKYSNKGPWMQQIQTVKKTRTFQKKTTKAKRPHAFAKRMPTKAHPKAAQTGHIHKMDKQKAKQSTCPSNQKKAREALGALMCIYCH